MFTLNESLDISNVVDCKVQYQEWLQQATPLVIDATHVSRVDAAGVQLLVSFVESARLAERDIRLENISEALQEGIDVLGLERWFMESQDATRKT
ncbi:MULTISPECIES: STAS domain-containing protein [Vibrio]|uniref:STAS domain-containing protein n=1 Tax=Vibrio TaxID=662 RepID=UPI001EEB16A0|nr:STAS domain-containing protein [Vibrio furnissii]MCG6259322.1 STAS domain-containing protein [Vibrio furnissii]MCG6480812.1 STAS domain-containing protein [Vibrio parahaemolyticus]